VNYQFSGQTVCVASVYGPIEVKLQNLDIDKASIEVFYRPKAGLSSVTDRLKEKIIRNTCNSALISTLHPRTAISIQIQEMEDKGGVN
jgi:exosome complex component RRP46